MKNIKSTKSISIEELNFLIVDINNYIIPKCASHNLRYTNRWFHDVYYRDEKDYYNNPTKDHTNNLYLNLYKKYIPEFITIKAKLRTKKQELNNQLNKFIAIKHKLEWSNNITTNNLDLNKLLYCIEFKDHLPGWIEYYACKVAIKEIHYLLGRVNFYLKIRITNYIKVYYNIQ